MSVLKEKKEYSCHLLRPKKEVLQRFATISKKVSTDIVGIF
ncbi:hypothetical protein IGJ34_000896 [Enterococcus sp. AZ177]